MMNSRFEKGSLVDVYFKGIVTDVILGKSEGNTTYDVFIEDMEVVVQFPSQDIHERSD